MHRPTPLVVALTVVAAGCYASHLPTVPDASITPLDAAPPRDAPAPTRGIVYPACGPADGPAVLIELSLDPLVCGDTATGSAGLTILLYSIPPVAPATRTFTLGTDPALDDGSGNTCYGTGTCPAIVSGTAIISRYEPGIGMQVDAAIMFDDGVREETSGYVLWCPRTMTCG